MSGKPSIKNELIEELMESKSLLSNFAQDASGILESLNENERLDFENDKLRNETMGFLLKSMEAYNAKDYEGMQKYLHAAIQKLHSQESLDFKDDNPRCEVKIKLSEARLNTIHTEEKITKLLEKLGGKKNGQIKS